MWGLQQIPCRDPEQRVGEVATAIPDPGGLVPGGEATNVEGGRGRRVAVPAFAAVEIVKGDSHMTYALSWLCIDAVREVALVTDRTKFGAPILLNKTCWVETRPCQFYQTTMTTNHCAVHPL